MVGTCPQARPPLVLGTVLLLGLSLFGLPSILRDDPTSVPGQVDFEEEAGEGFVLRLVLLASRPA